MEFAIIQQQKKQRYLILVLAVVFLATTIVIWLGLIKRKEMGREAIEEPYLRREVKINFEVLKNPVLEELQPFEEIKPFGEEIGRENPFRPY